MSLNKQTANINKPSTRITEEFFFSKSLLYLSNRCKDDYTESCYKVSQQQRC